MKRAEQELRRAKDEEWAAVAVDRLLSNIVILLVRGVIL